MIPVASFVTAPGETRDYTFNATLPTADSLTSVTWTTSVGASVDRSSNTANQFIAWITIDANAKGKVIATFTATSAAGRVWVRSIELRIE
jgi:hypothetical protein